MKTNQITISGNEIIDLFSFLYKNLTLVKQGNNLILKQNGKNLAIVKLNEYNSIIGLKLQRRYGYLNEFILRQILGLVYKEEKDDKLSKEV